MQERVLNPGTPSRIVATLLAQAGIPTLEPIYVLDMTYGRGTWWIELPNAAVYGVDIHRLDWLRPPKCFKQAPAQTWRRWISEVPRCLGADPQIVAVDPPWQSATLPGTQRRRRNWVASRALGTPEEILRAALDSAAHLGVPVLVRWREPLRGGQVLSQLYTRPPNASRKNYTAWWGVLRP